MMKKYFLLCACLAAASLSAADDTVLFGPTYLRVNGNGDLTRVQAAQSTEEFDNLWAYRYYPSEKRLTGRGVKIAIADSGIASHQEFNGKNIQGQDFTLSGGLSDLKNHGTGVAGVIGARGVRFTGIAPEASIVAYKIDDGSSAIGPQAAASAVNTVLKYNEEHPDDKIAVINLSYGASGGGFVKLTEAINRAHATGVIVVCPAGNDGFPGVHYPANQSTTLAVAALAAGGKAAYSTSSYGPEVAFIAPGERVYSTSADNDYMLLSGTSIAAGFVSGAAALAVEGFKNKYGRYPSFEEVKDALKNASARIPGIPDVKQGNGFIDVRKLERQFETKS